MSAPLSREPAAVHEREDEGTLLDWTALRDAAGFARRALRRHGFAAAVAFLGVIAGSALVVWALPRSYEARATALAMRNPAVSALSNPGRNRPLDAEGPTRASRELILRRENLVALIARTGLVARTEAARAPAVRLKAAVLSLVRGRDPTAAERVDALVKRLEKDLAVDVTESTVALTLQWPDADAARDVVEAAVAGFLEDRRSTEVGMVSDALGILEAHAAELEGDVGRAVRAIEERQQVVLLGLGPKRARTGAIQPGRSDDDAAELARAAAQLSAKRREIQNLRDQRQRKVEELQAELGRGQAVYGARHPAIEALQDTIAELGHPSPQITQLEREADALETRIASLGGDPGVAGGAVAALAATGSEAEREDPVLAYRRGALGSLLQAWAGARQRVEDARLELEAAKESFKYRYGVVTPPERPEEPKRPSLPLVALAALAGGALVAGFTAVALDLRAREVRDRFQLERSMGVKVLAEIDP